MMKYLTGFDENGRTSFSYYRERILKNHKGFRWQGRVHEAVPPAGNILYTDIEIQHRKEGAGDKDRNLRIYETMLSQGEPLEPDTSSTTPGSCITTNAMKMRYGCSGYSCRNRMDGWKTR